MHTFKKFLPHTPMYSKFFTFHGRVKWGGMGMWGEMGSLLIFELQKKENNFFKK